MGKLIFLSAFVVSCLLCSSQDVLAISNKPVTTSQLKTQAQYELRYRDIYFHYYRKDLFTSLSRLMAEMEMGRLPPRGEGHNLLLGALYTSYELRSDAEDILSLVANSSGNRRHLDLAWFYLARLFFGENNYSKTSSALSSVRGQLPPNLLPEFQYIYLALQLDKGNFEVAQRQLKKMEEEGVWHAYGQYNLGANLVKRGKTSQGLSFLDSVGELPLSSEELGALRDKSNVTLGFYFLRRQNDHAAIKYFQRVRMTGQFSKKALLGLGWAYSQSGNYKTALVPWIKLSRDNIYDSTVQEGILAAAFALQKVAAQQQAMDNYNNAISIYQTIKTRINESMHDVRSGKISTAVLNGEQFDDIAITQRLENVLSKDKGHLLRFLLQDEEFQYVFKQYRDVRYLYHKTQEWKSLTRRYGSMMPEQKSVRNGQLSSLKTNGEIRFSTRDEIDDLKVRILSSEKRLKSLLADYELALQKKMLEKLDQQYVVVTNYLSQARYAVAELLDKPGSAGVLE